MDIRKGMKVEYENKIYTITQVHYEYDEIQDYWNAIPPVQVLIERASWVQMTRKEKGVEHTFAVSLHQFNDFVTLGIIKILHTKKKNNYY